MTTSSGRCGLSARRSSTSAANSEVPRYTVRIRREPRGRTARSVRCWAWMVVVVSEGAAEPTPVDLGPLVAEWRIALGHEHVITHEHQLRTYESDGLLQYAGHARARWCCPASTAEVQARGGRLPPRGRAVGGARRRVRACREAPLPVADGVLIALTRMRRILEVDLAEPARGGGARRDQRGRVARPWAPPTSTRPTRRARSSARSAATWPRTRAAPTASSTASPPTT